MLFLVVYMPVTCE